MHRMKKEKEFWKLQNLMIFLFNNCKDNGMLVIEDTGKISAYLEGKEISLESLYFLEK